MKLTVIRPAPYVYKFKGQSLYESYNLVAANAANPNIHRAQLSNRLSAFKNYQIASSPLKRARQTADAVQSKYRIVEELKEVEYSMKQLLSEAQFQRLGDKATTYARIRFFEALFNNELDESLHEVHIRVERLVTKLSQYNKPVLAVSHGFFMKYLEFYLRDKHAALNYSEFQEFYDGTHPTYEFLEGFEVELALRNG